jgi:calcineurin-like phosphoesterase family protein
MNWFTSDTHFQHEKIIGYCNRPFKSIEEHDSILIESWNHFVKPTDTVYHLGDFAWKDQRIARKLNGGIHLIRGNHDKKIIMGIFKSVSDYVKEVTIGDYLLWLSHYSHNVWRKPHKGSIHLYGHSHGTLPDNPHSISMDVGVDYVYKLTGLYRPLSFDEILAFMGTKMYEPVDYHMPPLNRSNISTIM